MAEKQSGRTDAKRKLDAGSSGLWAWVAPNVTVFMSSACIMVIELVAGRLIARHLGSSLYTWTSVIGVVLAGIAIGNYVGGRLADRFSARPTLSLLFILSSLMAATIPSVELAVGNWSALWAMSWSGRVASHVMLTFFLPSAMLGTISPVVAKMALDLGRQTGRTVGSVYAWGVVGSIVGTFLTGFWLIDSLGNTAVVWCVAVVLALMAILYGARSWKAWSSVGVLACLAVLSVGPWAWAEGVGERLSLREPADPRVLYADESQYSYISVIQTSESPDTRSFILDKLAHSIIEMESPAKFEYPYEKIYAALTNRLSRGKRHVDSLTIGGGGYVYPRWMESKWPGSRTEVAEIDPAVTEAAMVAFGLSRDTSVKCIHEDGRVYLDRLARLRAEGDSVGLYDFIYCDAVNDYAVPAQLTTVEFVRMVQQSLKPDGAYLMNLIDVFDSGLLLGSLYNTINAVFPHVYVFLEGHTVEQNRDGRDTFIILGLNRAIDLTNLGTEYKADCVIYPLSQPDLDELVERSGGFVLTDDHAPVENFLSSVVEQDAPYRAIEEYLDRASIAKRRGDSERALDILLEGMVVVRERTPNWAWAFFRYGNAFYGLKHAPGAVEAYEKSVELQPNLPSGIFNLGNAYAATGRLREAARCFHAVLQRNPEDQMARLQLNMVLEALQRQQSSSQPAEG